MKQDFKEDFKEMCKLISGDTPFAFMRFADGEIGVMQGKQVNGSDNWVSPNSLTKLGEDLLVAIKRTDPNIYYGLSCECCDVEGNHYLLNQKKTSMSNITFSNLFVNGNYDEFKSFFNEIKKPINLIANERATTNNFHNQIRTFLPIPDNCVLFWEQLSVDFKELLKLSYQNTRNELFLISAGPMSEAIIDYLWTINPTNQYVDVGSAIAEYVHGHPIRDFAYKNSPYNNRNCVFTYTTDVVNTLSDLEELKVVIPTCDKYIHLIEGLMYTINKFWSANNKFIILGYTPPKYKLYNNWEFVSLGIDTGPQNWSNDLLKFFNSFEDKYFINMIDDTLMTRSSDMNKINAAYKYMKKNLEVGKCFLHGSLTTGGFDWPPVIPIQELDNMFCDVSQTSDYRTSIQSAIWSTDYFLQNLKPNMTPWDFETQFPKNDNVRILTTKEHHPTMFSHLYRIGYQLQGDWFKSVFEDTQLPDSDVEYLKTLLKL